MFAPISAIFGLFVLASTLPNGIRVDELPAVKDSVEIVAGYASGGLTDFESTDAANALLRTAYAAGGNVQLLNELDRTALRIIVPSWASPALFDGLPALFKDVPEGDKGADHSSLDFRGKVEEEIRDALLGARFSGADYGTGDAFILSTTAPPKAVLDALGAIPKRASMARSQEQINRLPAERTLRFKSDLPAGAVIFAAPAPSVYYRQWYLLLLLDELIHRVVPLSVKTSLTLNVRPYYYRIELPLDAGQFPEPAEANLLQELERLQFTLPNPRDLNGARQDARDYLGSKDVQEWFASHGIADRLAEGVQWVQSITADDLRAGARDLLIMNRVVASWAPKARETSVSVEPLNAGNSQASPPAAKADSNKTKREDAVSVPVTVFSPHTDASTLTPVPERLASGVSVVLSNTYAVFVSGASLTRINNDPTGDDLKMVSSIRADRILVLTPPASLDRVRQLWSNFKGSNSGPTGVPKGKVSTGDLPALFVLKTLLDLNVIDSGWRDVQLRIDASEGSGLQIMAPDNKRAQILEWIKSIGSHPPTESYFNWVREVAKHHFDAARPDLQALIWERDAQGTFPDLSSVSPQLVQDVARIYFN